MIELNDIFSDSDERIALWCENRKDTNDLAIMADNIIENGISLISVLPQMVPFMWTCLEKSGVRILARYDFAPLQKNMDEDVQKLVKQINDICKHGADGVQIFLKMRDFEHFIDVLSIVRDDLFFNRKLCICMDIGDIDIHNLKMIFDKLNAIRVDAFGVTLLEDMGNRSDFIGRIYALLQNWDYDGMFYCMFSDNYDRIDQTIRLAESIKPELGNKLRFFLEY